MAAAFWRAGESLEHTRALFTTTSPGFGLCVSSQAGCAACSLAAGHQHKGVLGEAAENQAPAPCAPHLGANICSEFCSV